MHMTTATMHTTTITATCICGATTPTAYAYPLDGTCAADLPDGTVIGDCCHNTHLDHCADYRANRIG